MEKGLLIALEGIDGTGKGTQAGLLVDALRAKGWTVDLFSFPAYGETFAGKLVGKYLDGALGDPSCIDSRLTATLYAIDRFEMKGRIETALEAGHLVVCDRYVGSNLAHQVARAAPRKRQEVRDFIDALEYQVFRLPRPSLVVFLDMPVSLAQERVLRKSARNYTKKKMDANEADALHLRRSLEEYRRQARRSPGWVRVMTTSRGGKGRDRDDIHRDVLTAVLGVLPR